jgi:NADH dehydrogenase [ubiquinone] 1 alpha subcomplex assembly factor 7
MPQADLGSRLIARIHRDGPITVAQYMDACLHDREAGYYATRPGLGAEGDFITAPHLSQMFGELLGLWAADVWIRLGRPARVRLVELGPGDGTLMSDALRAGWIAPGFLDAAEIVLVETSAPLRERQVAALNGHAPRWLSAIGDIDAGAPAIILGNEFLDCLPIRQAVRGADGWRERRIGIDGSGRLSFVAGQPVDGPEAPEGAVQEWSADLVATGSALGALVAGASGAALLIDYGRCKPGFGDTLQALRGHRKEDPLAHPGLADLTAHVDFPAFLAAAEAAGAQVWPAEFQGDFLRRLGIEGRASGLSRAHPDQAEKIGRQITRLTAPDQMGELFKVARIAAPGLELP